MRSVAVIGQNKTKPMRANWSSPHKAEVLKKRTKDKEKKLSSVPHYIQVQP